ncbi:MAG: TrkA family potassium uptake protein [Firmicutes bacterium]|nr:TrkA family potassium uptake protein [Bacillota bacterium]MCL5038791.1 TrkA family potassium uptake protein [Bacillota bacterium]
MGKKEFAVLGLGRFGSSVATTLTRLGYPTLGADRDEAVVNELSSFLPRIVQADTTREDVLSSMNLKDCAAVIIGIGSFQESVITAVRVKRLGVNHILAKAYDEVHSQVLKEIGVDRIVCPEKEMGARVALGLVSPSIVDYIELSPELGVLDVTIGEGFAGKSLRQLRLPERFGVNVVAVKRGKRIEITLPPDESLQVGDILALIGERQGINRLSVELEGKLGA